MEEITKIAVIDSKIKGLTEKIENYISDSKIGQKELCERIESLKEKVSMIDDIDRKLLDVGIDFTERSEHQKDMSYIRRSRLNQENRNRIIAQTLMGVVITSILFFTGNAIYEKFVEDVKKEQGP